MKCESCDDECKNKAEYECESCGTRFCKECAENLDYECDCEPLPRLIPIKKVKR